MNKALQAWEDGIAVLEGLSGGVVCVIDGLLPAIEVSDAVQQAIEAVLPKVKALPKLPPATWSQLIDTQVGYICCRCGCMCSY